MGVRPIAQEDEVRAIDAVVLGFVADPMTRWVWPRSHHWLPCQGLSARSAAPASPAVAAIVRVISSGLPCGCHLGCIQTKNGWTSSWRAPPRQLPKKQVPRSLSRWRPTIQRSRTGTCRSLGWILHIRTKVMAMRSCGTHSSGAIATSCPRTSSPRTRGMCPSTAGTGSRHSARYRPAPRLHSCRCFDERVERLFSRAGNRRPT